MSALKYWLWLTALPKVGNQLRLALLQQFGSPEDIYFADQESYLHAGADLAQAQCLSDKRMTAADRILGRCDALGVRIVTMQDADYPDRLRNIFDPPCILYAKGRMPRFDEELAIAMVGTRQSTPYGEQAAEELGYGLAQGGALVMSGLARGIDTCSLRGALRAGGVTAAVLGGGVDVIYPRENAALFEDVAATGVLLSEYPPGTETMPGHFPVRNRILAGLCAATLVVEAPKRSGALITANLALEQSRDVFAVPGPIFAKSCVGSNHLIRDGAGLVEEAWDLLREYTDRFPGKLKQPQSPDREVPAPAPEPTPARTEPAAPARETFSFSQKGSSLTDDQVQILKTLAREGTLQVDDLIDKTEIPARRMLSALTVLELEGLVTQASGKQISLSVILTE